MDSRYKELSDKAFNYHKNNNFKEAENLYTLLLQINPNDINILNLYGLLCIVLKKYKDAINYLTRAAVLRPNAYISSNLAKAYFEAGQYKNSIIIFERIAHDAPSFDVFYSLGIAYKTINNYDNAVKSYKKAIELNSVHFSSLYNLANLYMELNKITEAKEYAIKALAINSKDVPLHSLLSEIYSAEENYIQAIEELKICINYNPNNYLYYYNTAVLSSKIKNYGDAKKYYIKALEINPGHINSMINLASLYKDDNEEESLKILESAYKISSDDETLCLSLAQVYRDLYENNKSINILKELIKRNPQCDEAYMQLGTNYMDEGKYKIALNNFDKAIELSPDNLNYQHCRATALKYRGRIFEAEKILKKIVKNSDASLKSKLSLAMIYLQKKEFNKGMKLYGQRYLEDKMPQKIKDNIWNKSEKIRGKSILVYSNCGLGDTLMFARYIPFLKKICNNIALQTDKELFEILKYNYTDINVYKKSEQVKNFDTILQIMDSAYALNMDFNKIPFSEGYLKADINKIKEFKKQNIFNTRKLKVGIFYQGNKNIFRNRALPFKYVEELAQLKNIRLYSFQIENNEKETNNIVSLKEYIKDYGDTAALLNCIDILITIDSSIVHMAGALGIKTKLLIPKVAEWRWFDDTKTTPWYDSVEIIRQKKAFDWTKEIEKIKSELNEYKR